MKKGITVPVKYLKNGRKEMEKKTRRYNDINISGMKNSQIKKEKAKD